MPNPDHYLRIAFTSTQIGGYYAKHFTIDFCITCFGRLESDKVVLLLPVGYPAADIPVTQLKIKLCRHSIYDLVEKNG